jgi:hypothetical protein
MATYYTQQNGDITQAATWGGTVPGSGDNAYVYHVCTLSNETFTCNLLDIGADGVGSLAVTGACTINGSVNGTGITVYENANLTVNGNATAANGVAGYYSGAWYAATPLFSMNQYTSLTVTGLASSGAGGNGDGGTAGGSGQTGYSDGNGDPINGASGNGGNDGGNGGQGCNWIQILNGYATVILNGSLYTGGGGAGGPGANGGSGGSGGTSYGDAYGSGGPGGSGGCGGNGGYGGYGIVCDNSANVGILITGASIQGSAGAAGSSGQGGYGGSDAGGDQGQPNNAQGGGAGGSGDGYGDSGGQGGDGGGGGSGGLAGQLFDGTPTQTIGVVFGPYTMPSASTVENATAFGLGNSVVGTYNPLATAVFPPEDQVLETIQYGPSGDDYTGTLSTSGGSGLTNSEHNALMALYNSGNGIVLASNQAVNVTEWNGGTLPTSFGLTNSEHDAVMVLATFAPVCEITMPEYGWPAPPSNYTFLIRLYNPINGVFVDADAGTGGNPAIAIALYDAFNNIYQNGIATISHQSTGHYLATMSNFGMATGIWSLVATGAYGGATFTGQAYFNIGNLPLSANQTAEAILTNGRTNLLTVDTNGAVAVNNFPSDYQQRGQPVTMPVGGVALAASQPNYAPAQAADILATPANKLATDTSGNVTPAVGSITDASFTLPTVTGMASGPVGMLLALWRRFFYPAKKTLSSGSGQIICYASDGNTVITTQSITDDGTGNETISIGS